jgi:hypothetical protein
MAKWPPEAAGRQVQVFIFGGNRLLKKKKSS